MKLTESKSIEIRKIGAINTSLYILETEKICLTGVQMFVSVQNSK